MIAWERLSAVAQIVGVNALAVVALMLATWLVSLAKKDASIVDVVWGLGFVAVAWLTYARLGSGAHALLMCALVTLWGARLSLHILVRGWGKPEDVRYQTLRAKYAPFAWKSLLVVFALQGALLLVVSLPVQVGQRASSWTELGPLDLVGVAVFAVGFAIEALADAQLVRAKRARPGAVVDVGLWRWSRHPNYFGEIVLWWGLGLMAVSSSPLALAGPLTITWLLVRVSGVPMLERAMKDRPGYAEYVARTSPLLPRPPR